MNDRADLPASAGEELAAEMRQRVRASGTSFYGAMRLLPRARQDAMYAIYAFCREVDDIADGPSPRADKLARLEDWRREIELLYAGEPRHAVARALSRPVTEYCLRREDFLALIDGMRMDAERDIRAPSLADLDLYCGRVAGAVGRLSVRAFGDMSAGADKVADHLGRALQLTNILRDLAEDAAAGRLYLPRELLDRHGIAGSDPAQVLRHPALTAVCRDIAAQATRHFAEARRWMAQCSRRAMRPAAVMGAIYRRLLDRLLRRGWATLEPVQVPKLVKLWLALRHGLL